MIRRLFRRVVPAPQVAYCTTCRTQLVERWRKPCPKCGDRTRVHYRRFPIGSLGAFQHMGTKEQ